MCCAAERLSQYRNTIFTSDNNALYHKCAAPLSGYRNTETQYSHRITMHCIINVLRRWANERAVHVSVCMYTCVSACRQVLMWLSLEVHSCAVRIPVVQYRQCAKLLLMPSRSSCILLLHHESGNLLLVQFSVPQLYITWNKICKMYLKWKWWSNFIYWYLLVQKFISSQ